MQNKKLKFLKATIISIIVAFLFVAIVFSFYKICLEKNFETVAGLVEMFAVNKDLKTLDPVLQGNILLHNISSSFQSLIKDSFSPLSE